jgi:type I restriction enzyme M protein
MSQLDNIEAIEKCLWGSADSLRGNSNFSSNEYFLPVMGLIWNGTKRIEQYRG